MADDFSAPGVLSRHGFFEAQIASYRGWTGRFSFTFVSDLVALMGPLTPRFVPAVLLTLWFVAMLWAIAGIESIGDRLFSGKVVLFAGFVIFATVEAAPNVSQSLYWQTTALVYIAPLILLSLYTGLAVRGGGKRRKRQLLCAGILTFVAGGFSDACLALQNSGLILAIVAVEMLAGDNFKSQLRPFLIAGLSGSLLALIFVALAPGNSVRLSYFPTHLGAVDVVRLTLRYSLGFFAKQVFTHPTIFLASLILPWLTLMRSSERRWDQRRSLWIMLITPAAVFLMIACCVALGVYAMSVMVPERARILLSLVFVCGTLLWSRAAGEYLAGRLSISPKSKLLLAKMANLALLLLILSPLASFTSILGRRTEARHFAADWDRQDLDLRAAKQSGVKDVVVPQIGDFQSRIGKGPSDLHLRTDPEFWINKVTAAYYGLRSVRAAEDVPVSR
jgi:hypothetical protein